MISTMSQISETDGRENSNDCLVYWKKLDCHRCIFSTKLFININRKNYFQFIEFILKHHSYLRSHQCLFNCVLKRKLWWFSRSVEHSTSFLCPHLYLIWIMFWIAFKITSQLCSERTLVVSVLWTFINCEVVMILHLYFVNTFLIF